jgi:uncharacterized protein YjiS (DUF1127 family)
MEVIMNWLNKIFHKIVEAQEKRAQYWMLQNLSDKELRDIGIGRGQIREAIYGDAGGTSRC